MSEDSMEVARRALDLARDVERRVEGHEDICAYRYKMLESGMTGVKSDLSASITSVKAELASSVGEIKKTLAWVGTTVFLLLVATLGFFLKAQFDSNAKMQEQLQALQRQAVYERPHQ